MVEESAEDGRQARAGDVDNAAGHRRDPDPAMNAPPGTADARLNGRDKHSGEHRRFVLTHNKTH
jgi:hypothetical protein